MKTAKPFAECSANHSQNSRWKMILLSGETGKKVHQNRMVKTPLIAADKWQ
jgi:hypothetical protein